MAKGARHRCQDWVVAWLGVNNEQLVEGDIAPPTIEASMGDHGTSRNRQYTDGIVWGDLVYERMQADASSAVIQRRCEPASIGRQVGICPEHITSRRRKHLQ